MTEQSRTQTFHIQADELANHVKTLIAEGNDRQIVIRQGDRIVANIPLTIGVVGALVAPWAAAVGALAALVSDCTVEVVHDEATTEAPPPTMTATGTPTAEQRFR